MDPLQWIVLIIFGLVIVFFINSMVQVQRVFRKEEVEINNMQVSAKESRIIKNYYNIRSVSTYPHAAFFAFIALFLTFLSIAFMNLWFVEFNLARDSLNWLPVEAKVIGYKTNWSKTTKGAANYEVFSAAGIQYEFTVEGKALSGNMIGFDNKWNSSDSTVAKQETSLLPPVGSIVTIYYDKVSGKSVLYPGRENTSYSMMFFLMIFFCGAMFLIYLTLSTIIIRFVYKRKAIVT